MYATTEGTTRYIDRFPRYRDAAFYRTILGMSVSSLGIGTYLGAEDGAADPARKPYDASPPVTDGGNAVQRAFQTGAVVGVKLPDSADDVIDDLARNLVLVKDGFRIQIARRGNPPQIEDDLLESVPSPGLAQRGADAVRKDAQHEVEVIGDPTLRCHRR